ncbi:MAG: hypothetical protein QME45_13895 [Clostridiales bacterium]|nr:hypothetical protein [Clostridiales bacterium]
MGHIFDEKNIRERLISEFKYPRGHVDAISGRILKMNPEVLENLKYWWETGEIKPLEVHGYTLERLQKVHGMDIIAAYIMLDWLSSEPEKAKKSLARVNLKPVRTTDDGDG